LNGNDTLELQSLVADRERIENSLQNLRQILPPGTDTSSDLSRIAETKRLTALLYLHERLGVLPVSSKPDSGIFRSQLIKSIITLIKTLPNSPTLLWPLFILGSTDSILGEEQRRFVHERLTALQKVRNLGSVRRAKHVVEETWKRIDLELGLCSEISKPDSSFGKIGKRKNRLLISLA
jgi:hypothetical protein